MEKCSLHYAGDDLPQEFFPRAAHVRATWGVNVRVRFDGRTKRVTAAEVTECAVIIVEGLTENDALPADFHVTIPYPTKLAKLPCLAQDEPAP